MEVRDIKKYAWRGENGQVEFKRKVRHPEKIVREVVAFANSSGGHLFIGIDDNGKIPGVKHAEEEDFLMKKAIDELCRPTINYKSDIIPLNSTQSVIHYQIEESNSKPHFAFLDKKHRYGKAFVRINDKSIQASKEFRSYLKKKTEQVHSGIIYGEPEKTLLKYLEINEYITLSKFVEISELHNNKASSILVNMALNNVLRIIPTEEEDLFIFSG